MITDDRMQDRAQVILIITGLGATALDTRPRPLRALHSASAARSAAPAPAGAPEPDNNRSCEMAATDLDLPAFMRRRIR